MLRRRSLVVITVSAVSALAGAAWGVEEFVLLALAGAGLFAVGVLALCWQVRRARRGLELEVGRVGGELFVGDPAAVSLVGANSGRGVVPVLWLRGVERWRVSFPGLAAGVVVPGSAVPEADPGPVPGPRRWWRRLTSRLEHGEWTPLPELAPGEHCRVSLAVPTGSRGLWSWGPAELWCTDPFGLAAWRVATTPVARMVVLPVPAALDPADLPSAEPAGGRASSGGEGPPAWGGGGDEFAGLRPYVPGDRLTRLHWPALARNDQLVVRHFVEHQDPLDLVIDTRPWKIEAAVAAVAGIGTAALAAGRPLSLRTVAGEHLVVSPDRLGRARLLRALALVGSSTGGRARPAGAAPAAAALGIR